MSDRSISQLQSDISALDKALREIAMGKKTAKLSYDGNSVEYTPADIPTIKDLLAADRAELKRRTGGRTGPLRMAY